MIAIKDPLDLAVLGPFDVMNADEACEIPAIVADTRSAEAMLESASDPGTVSVNRRRFKLGISPLPIVDQDWRNSSSA